MMMMMMMSGFVDLVSPQMCYQSIEQVGLQKLNDRRQGESCRSRVVGKLFHIMTGPATAKHLVPSMVIVLGTDSDPVPVHHRCRLPAMREIAKQLSTKYVGANPCRDL